MKKQTLLILFSLVILINSCSKKKTSSSPTSSVSTFNITFNGKTLHETSDISHPITGFTTATSTIVPYETCEIAVSTNNLFVGLTGYKNDISTALGLYNNQTISSLDFIDRTDGNKQYSGDSSSTITITQADALWLKGTFNLILHFNGGIYPATGDFACKK